MNEIHEFPNKINDFPDIETLAKKIAEYNPRINVTIDACIPYRDAKGEKSQNVFVDVVLGIDKNEVLLWQSDRSPLIGIWFEDDGGYDGMPRPDKWVSVDEAFEHVKKQLGA